MLADCEIVVERAFAPDPRVPKPAPVHAGGADPGMGGTKEIAIGQFALYVAATEIIAGGPGKISLPPLLQDRWGSLLDACQLSILSGLREGAQVLPGDVLAVDPEFLAKVRSLLAEVERAAARPGLARLLEFVLEPEVFRPKRLTQQLVAGRALFLRQDIHHLAAVDPPAGVDTLHIEFRDGDEFLARAEAPLLGPASQRELAEIAIEAMSPTVYLRRSGVLRRPAFWLYAAIALARLPMNLSRGRRALRALAREVLVGAAIAVAGSPMQRSGRQALADLIAEGRAQALTADLPPSSVRPAVASLALDAPPVRNRRAYWEEVYRKPDPWAYGSDYEQLKYQRTIALLPPGPIGTALEVACSEGRFSALLAPRVGKLVASDISPTALERARERCRGIANIEFREHDFFEQQLPHGLDLLVCSEVLYDLPGPADLARVATRLVTALAAGGRLLSAHANVLKDDPSRTGADGLARDPGAGGRGRALRQPHGNPQPHGRARELRGRARSGPLKGFARARARRALPVDCRTLRRSERPLRPYRARLRLQGGLHRRSRHDLARQRCAAPAAHRGAGNLVDRGVRGRRAHCHTGNRRARAALGFPHPLMPVPGRWRSDLSNDRAAG